MFNNKLIEEMSQDPRSSLEIFRDAVTSASDLETQKIDYNGIIVGHILKSNSENKTLCSVCEKKDLVKGSLFCRHCGSKIDK